MSPNTRILPRREDYSESIPQTHDPLQRDPLQRDHGQGPSLYRRDTNASRHGLIAGAVNVEVPRVRRGGSAVGCYDERH
ncbi:hypothetical protein VNO78_03858 [Psophocarpus tetragonolobus]|uniref:Uncharacterized protein n=1 Tax=Psophocarpus tetragonolobus TaxID=3891 RepID=A0AAN9T1R4_PSOTE